MLLLHISSVTIGFWNVCYKKTLWMCVQISELISKSSKALPFCSVL